MYLNYWMQMRYYMKQDLQNSDTCLLNPEISVSELLNTWKSLLSFVTKNEQNLYKKIFNHLDLNNLLRW